VTFDRSGVLHGGFDTRERNAALAQAVADMTAAATQAAEICGPAAARLAEIGETVMTQTAELNKATAPFQPGPHTTAAELMVEMRRVLPEWPPR